MNRNPNQTPAKDGPKLATGIERNVVLVSRCGALATSFEANWRTYAATYIARWTEGGDWVACDLAELETFYAAPALSKERCEPLILTNAANYFRAAMSPEAVGIAISLLLQSHMACRLYEKEEWRHSERFTDLYNALRGHALGHEEEARIMGFID